MNRKVILIAAGVSVAAAAVAGGAAYAAGSFDSPQQQSKAVIDDAAKQLGIDPTKLSSALKKALEDQVDAQVAAGAITKAEGDAIKSKIEAGDYPPLGFGFRGGPGGPGFGFGLHRGGGMADLSAAASYLGLSESDLITQLQSGKTLADIAQAQGKSVDGLVAALVAGLKQKLDAAVAAGKLTQAQEDQILADAKQRITDRVNGKMPAPGDGPWGKDGGPGGPPPPAGQPGFFGPTA
jgi:hypothetical protein